MERIELKAQAREGTGKGAARRLRQQGFIPGVVYGPKTETVSLAVNTLEFTKALRGAAGGNAVINLEFEGSGKSEPKVVMVQDLHLEPLTHNVLHVDFQEIDLKEEVDVSIPIELVGKAMGIEDGGILQQIVRELEIRCLPLNIPEKVELDISNLGIGDSVHVSDIAATGDFEILSASDQTVASVIAPAAEEEEVEEAEAEEGEEAEAEEGEEAQESGGEE
jgi:large subunit ribosomal protein L25